MNGLTRTRISNRPLRRAAMRFFRGLLLVLLLAGTTCGEAGETVVPVLRLDQQTLAKWEIKEFKGITVYEPLLEDGRAALRAVSRGTASAFYREMEVDLQKYPYLSWSWKVVEAPPNPIETEKRGDDFAARVYVVVKTGPFPWQVIAFNYVWSMGDTDIGKWVSPYTEKMKMKALNRGSGDFGNWITHRVNVAADLQAAFGTGATKISGVAVMTDMDNTGGSATAYYGEISFSADPNSTP